MSTHDFKFTHPVINKVSNYKIKKLNLRHTRVCTFPLSQTGSKGLYLLPKKACFKYTKRFTFEFDGDSSRKSAIRALGVIKTARPTQLSIVSTGIYKLTEKLDLITWLNNPSNLSCLNFKIEGGLIENEIANLFFILLLRSPHLKSVFFDLKRCSIKPESINHIMEGLTIQSKLKDFVYNVTSADVSDPEITHMVEALLNPMNGLRNLESFIICLKANRRITDQGIESVANLLASLKRLVTFKFDMVSTSVTADGLKTLLNSLIKQQDLATFYIHASEISNIYSVLANFLESQPSLSQVGLDLSHDSQIDYETLKVIQTAVAKLPRLSKYKFNVDGCHSLKEGGTLYVPESLSVFQSLKELEVHFASFLDSEEGGQVALDTLITSMSHLGQLESLLFDFSSCSEWFIETGNEIQARFLDAFPLLKNLRSLSLNFKKSQLNSNNLQKLLTSLGDLKQLTYLELDLSFCRSIKEKDLRGALLHLAGSLNLTTLKILADDIDYDENKLSTDIHLAVKSSATLKELYISLKKTLMGRQAMSLVNKFEPKHPGIDLSIQGGKAFTILRPNNNNPKNLRPIKKSPFAKYNETE